MDSVSFRNKETFHSRTKKGIWRPRSLVNLSRSESNSTLELGTFRKEKSKKLERNWDTIAIIVLVEAINIPPVAEDGVTHNLYCKFRLGSETFKSKSVPTTKRPEWRERFQLRVRGDYCLNVSLRDRGKQKYSMGSCILDLSVFEKERTHEIWQPLEDGFGSVHLSVTLCTVRSIGSPEGITPDKEDSKEITENSATYLSSDGNVVGILHVTLFGAKGLTTKPNAYCVLEIDNERVQTHRAGNSSEPRWNKTYKFNVFDVSSTLDLKVYDSAITNVILNESIGKISIPLLRIVNDEMHWYALKNRSKRNIARGNCPRVLLKMNLKWNPVKAALRLFQPKEVKYIKKSPKFDIPLVYYNMKVVSGTLTYLAELNESYKRLFEWDDTELSVLATVAWIALCYYIRLWTIPLLLLLPFIFFWFRNRDQDFKHSIRDIIEPTEKDKDKDIITGTILDLHKLTFSIKNSIDYIVSCMERLYNLVTFKVPFLSYVAMAILLFASVGLYFIPFNYILMSLGIYKFTRKFLNPHRILNNDLLDFISRIPDNEMLRDWKELSVPEPRHEESYATRNLVRSFSTSLSHL